MKNILFVDDQMYKLFGVNKESTGGAAVQTSSWLLGFKNLGYNVKFTSPKKITKEALVFKYLHSSPKYFIWIFYLYNYYKVVKLFNPSIIYVSTAGWRTIIWAIIAKSTNAKYVQRISNKIVFEKKTYKKKLGFFKYQLSRIGVKYADLILCQNYDQYSNINKMFPQINKEIIYNPYFVGNDAQLNLKKKYYVSWVGIFQDQKNIPALLKIVKSCKEINFKIAGDSNQSMSEATNLAIHQLRKMKNVEFVGFLGRDEIKIFLSKSVCLLNTSHYEGFSNTYLEAFENRTPVITRRVTDPDGIIEKNNLGFVADNYTEIPYLIKNILKNGFSDHQNLRNYLKENHDPNVLANDIINLLNKG